jgi:hypothetical protein
MAVEVANLASIQMARKKPKKIVRPMRPKAHKNDAKPIRISKAEIKHKLVSCGICPALWGFLF